ncbi:MAG: prevent-host-death family protein [Gleimia sp.]
MVSSFFSRSKSHDDDRSKKTRSGEATPDSAQSADARNSEVKSNASEGGAGTDRSQSEADGRTRPLSPNDELINRRHAVAKWREELDAITRSFVEDPSRPRLDMTYAHPGGMAQLFAERTTRLSLLVREAGEAERARRIVRELMDQARSVAVAHGVAPIHMSFGHAFWNGEHGQQTSPMLLREVDIELDSMGDPTIRLTGRLTVAPELVAAAQKTGTELDTQAIVDSAHQAHGFTPTPALSRLRDAISGILPGFKSDERMEIAQFLHPAHVLADELNEVDRLLESTFVTALTGDERAADRLKKDLAEPNPFDRDPWKERGIGDQLPEDLDSVEAVAAGTNVMFDVAGGAEPAPMIASIVADAAAQDKKVLVVAADRHRNDALWNFLNDQGLAHAVARLDGAADAKSSLITNLETIFRDESPFVDRESIELMRTQLRRVREALASHTEELHRPFAQWGVSAYDALQVLTDLTSTRPGPRTKVRFSAETLTNLAEDKEDAAKAALRTAVDQGMFSKATSHDAWFGAVISSDEQVSPVLERINRLSRDSLPTLRVNMSSTAGQTGLNPATTFKEWREQLRMLEGVREALDVFQPAIFERQIADMVIATASKQWRRDHGYPMKRRQRRHLVKSAKDMLRPGRYVEDLNEELRKVQHQRDVWRRHQAVDGWPKAPSNLDEMKEHADRVEEDLQKLDAHLATAHGPLTRMDVGELSLLMDRLNADPAGARVLPERIETLKTLHKFGLDGLVKDLRKRNVPASLVEKELDLAWWASALGVMLTQVPSLGGFDPANLQNLIVDLQRLDKEQVESLAAVASDKIRRRRVDKMAHHFEEEAQLRNALGAGKLTHDLDMTMYASSKLTQEMFPIVISAPVLVPSLVPLRQSVDLLVIEDVDQMPLAELVPLIARARQVVVTADKSRPSLTVEALDPLMATARIKPVPMRVNEYVGRLFNRYRVAHAGVPVPVPRAGSKLAITYVDGRGMPAPDKAAVESSAEEVDAVTEMVIEHALVQPEKSLAVVTLNQIHAERLRENLSAMVAKSPALESFFRIDRPDPFVIIAPGDDTNLRRDRVILSVGFAKTPHGRVLHDFGAISEADGLQQLVEVLGCAGDDLHIVASIHPGQFDRDRFTSDGPRLLLDLMSNAEALSSGQALDGGVGLAGGSGAGLFSGGSGAGSASGGAGLPGASARSQGHAVEGHGASGSGRQSGSGSDVGSETDAGVRTEIGAGADAGVRTETGTGADAGAAYENDWPTTQAQPDQLLIDLADRLYSVGLTVIPNVGVEGSLRVPLAIGHPTIPDELLVAVLTDDETYVAERSLRRRDRYWPELLQAHGWKTRTELAMAVFIDPQKEADAIVDLVLDALDERLEQDPVLAARVAAEHEPEQEEPVSVDAPAGDDVPDTDELEQGSRSPEDLATGVNSDSDPNSQSDQPGKAAGETGEESSHALGNDSDPNDPEMTSNDETFGTETAAQRMIRLQADEDIHGTGEIPWQRNDSDRKRRPEVAVGLPLAAYSDDQLDEVARWIRSDGIERSEDEMVVEIQRALALTRRGAQVEAVLRNVARRTRDEDE